MSLRLFLLHLERKSRQPVARRRAGAFWETNDWALTWSVCDETVTSVSQGQAWVLYFAPQA
jgi:hypothetical protein